MNTFSKIGFFEDHKKDWHIIAASLFLFLFPLLLFSQNDSLTLKKPTQPTDTIKDTLAKISSFLPPSLQGLHLSKKDTLVYHSFFYPHALRIKNLEETDRKQSINDWAFIILLIGFLLMAAVQFSYHKRMLQIIKAFLASRFLNQLMRGSDFYKERITYNLYLIFLLVFPLLLFEVNTFFHIYPLPRRPYTELLFYLELLFFNLLLYTLKVISLRFAGNIFKTQEITGEYLMTHFIFSLVQGVAVLVLMTVVVFTHSVFALEIGLVIIVMIYFFQLLRGFVIGLRNAGYSVLYLLLFFFTIEVLPILLLVKLIAISIAV